MRLPNALLFVAAPAGSALFAFITVPLLTWTAPEHVIVKYGLFQYATSALLLLFTCGLDQAFFRELSSCRSPPALLRRCLSFSLSFLFLAAAISYFGGGLPKQLFGAQAPWLTGVMLLNVGFLVVHRFGAQQARLSDTGGAAYLSAELSLRLPLVGSLLFAFCSSSPVDAHDVFVPLVVGSCIAALVMVGSSWTSWARILHPAHGDDDKSLPALLGFGLPLALAGLLYWGMTNSGAYLTQMLHGPTEASRLVVAASVANVAALAQTMFSLLWLPRAYRTMDTSLAPEDIGRIARKVAVGAACVFACLSMALFAAQFFLDPRYRDVSSLATSLCVLPALYAISEVTFIGVLKSRKTRWAIVATGIGVLLSLLVNAALTPRLGAVGACIATAVSAMFFLIARTEIACHGWQTFRRAPVYFAGGSVTCVGIVAPFFAPGAALLSLMILLPYLWSERWVLAEMIRSARLTLVQSSLSK